MASGDLQGSDTQREGKGTRGGQKGTGASLASNALGDTNTGAADRALIKTLFSVCASGG